MRRFELHRDEDVSGVSGTGIVRALIDPEDFRSWMERR